MQRYLLAAAVLLLTAACQKEQTGTRFSLTSSQITVGAEGGTETVRIESDGAWIANTESPWITVSPVNGHGSIDCRIKVDTTLLADDIRQGVVRFSADGHQPLDLRIVQTGFEKMIRLSKTEVELPNYGKYGERYFDVELTANVPFEIDKPADANWLDIEDYSFSLDRGSRPRTVKLRVKWDSNTRPSERRAVIGFEPADGETLAHKDRLTVMQEMAEKIEPTRSGDSLAVVGCMRSLGLSLGSNENETLDHWSFLSLWEPTDEGFDESKRGRVKSIIFSFFETKEPIPFEIQYLTAAESITFYSNGNAHMKSFGTGEYISKLTNLKHLDITFFGLDRIDDDFANLKSLETLAIPVNNFKEVPAVLTPENFPNLRSLSLMINQCVHNLNGPDGATGGLPLQLLRWEALEKLYLNTNSFFGSLPSDEELLEAGFPTYTEEDVMRNDTLPDGSNNPAGYTLVGKPKVLPKATRFGIGYNYFTGMLPEWILYHPYLMNWDPTVYIFSQESEALDPNGKVPGFDNVPLSPNYYYEAYPLRRPDNYNY